MIRFSDGDIFAADCEALVNPVNCVGVMGAGMARAVRSRYPDACGPYLETCERGGLLPGGVVLAYRPGEAPPPHLIFHAATKMHWRMPARLSWTGQCLDTVAGVARVMRLKSVAVPALGCGRGGLKWAHVLQQMEAFLGDVEEVEWVVFPPREGL